MQTKTTSKVKFRFKDVRKTDARQDFLRISPIITKQTLQRSAKHIATNVPKKVSGKDTLHI